MKLSIIDKTGKKTGDYELNIKSDIREDIYKKAVNSERSLFRQSYGADPLAGKKNAIHLSKRRRKLRTTYGRGGSRTPKKVMWSRGTQFRFVGAFASNTVGGRRAHPPKPQKILLKDLNNKEWLLALKTGLVASMTPEIVSKLQKVSPKYPFVLNDDFEQISKTKEMKEALATLGFEEELARISEKSIKPGKATMRNRKYKIRRGPLLVFSSVESPALKSARNIQGVDVMTPDLLMAADFGMSEKPGRTVLFTKAALEEFMEVFK